MRDNRHPSDTTETDTSHGGDPQQPDMAPLADGATPDPTPDPTPGATLRKLAVDLGPLVVFFVAYRFGGEDDLAKILTATAAFMAAMVVAMAYSWWESRKITPMLGLTFVIVMVMGGLTLYFSDETFVKMKPTIVNGIFASILGFGLLRGQSYLRLVLEAGFPPISRQGWMIMTRNWVLYFALMAVLNEIVWRTQTTDMWVSVKTFGYFPLTILFSLSQIPVISKYALSNKP